VERERFERHLSDPRGRGGVPKGAAIGSAGGAPCGDLVRIALLVHEGRIAQATFDADGCGAALAAGSACVELVEGARLIDAARVGAAAIDSELGGLSPGKLHAADLASDALHRALSSAVAGTGPALANPDTDRVLVALSGGVDSAVAALLEREAGADVIAVTLKLWADPAGDGTKSCCSPEAVVRARALAHSLEMPHLTLDLQEGFRSTVVSDFLAEHDRGRTPNPCVRCNGIVRFDAMLVLARRLGASALATGHYARVERDGEGPLLARAADAHKDQTYMLSGLRPQLLERIRFPLAALTKPQVRAIARRRGLAVADKSDSQDLCFLAGTSRSGFLARHGGRADRSGEIVDSEGRVLGRHPGHRRFTVGQRRGLGLAAHEPRYVLGTDAAKNRVIVGGREQLAVREVTVGPATLYRDGGRVDRVKLRYRSEPVPCSVSGKLSAGRHESLTVVLEEPVYGAAAGQTACLLEGERVLGHGTIVASAAPAAA
jgi:tRNA-uridine 2-sulfurtransferase